MTRQDDVAQIVRDPNWFAHRYDEGHDAIQFIRIDREQHRAAAFLRDEFLPGSASPLPLGRTEALQAIPVTGPLHFIFHSAYCCSTLLARAFDVPGHAMGLKEPLILNDMVGWNLRGGDRQMVGNVLGNALTMLARPFAPGEAVIAKPSNIINGFTGAILGLRPQARALFLHAPLRTYLASIAKKGMEGRLWVRVLLLNMIKEQRINLGFRQEQYLEHTDLQAAAIGWLVQHAEFQRHAAKFGRDRVATLNSETLLADPLAAMRALNSLFGTRMSEDMLSDIVAGPAFGKNAKSGETYGTAQRDEERTQAMKAHAHELDWVAGWAERVAQSNGISMELPAPLLG